VDNSTVKQLDIHQYMGKWYEIARYDHSFERGMTHVYTEYSLEKDGKIRVVNHGIKNGKPKEIVGKGKQPNPKEYPGRLKVSFFLWFYADYYILELGENYQYALVGSSSDKYLWILSRTPEMTKAQLDGLLQNIAQRGYDLSKLIFVEQHITSPISELPKVGR
jgi:lipocalin